MKITVIGGTGLIGSKLVNKLRQLGHGVVVASTETGVNILTGQGLQAAVNGSDAVVDVSNSPSFEGDAPMNFFRTSTMNILTVSIYANVKHYVALSVVGCDRLPDSPYLRSKVAQEELIEESGIPYTILRSTQFFEFAPRIAQAGMVGDEIHMSPAAFQPIAGDEVAEALTDILTGPALNSTVDLAGPVRTTMYEFIRYFLNASEDSRQLVSDENTLYFGARFKDDSLVPDGNPRLGKTRYEEWFSKQLASA